MRGISRFSLVRVLVLFVAVAVCANWASAITVTIDYKYDDGFFAEGSQARTAMEAAASYYSTILEDTFDGIKAPDKYYGSKGGEATWFWKRRFINPTTGFNEAAVNVEIEEDEYVVFVGARDLPEAGTLGLGGPGGFAVRDSVHTHGDFTAAETAEIKAIDAAFRDAVNDRGETSGFGRWGGSIAFDKPTDWHFNHTTAPSGGKHDFYSTALHELAHVLGFGIGDNDTKTMTPWESLVSANETSSSFTGSNANKSYAPTENVPLESKEKTAHWGKVLIDSVPTDITSPIYEGSGTQVPLMVPSIDPNTRRVLTDIDVAALVDIGWDIDLPASSASAASFVSLGSVNVSSGSASVAALSMSVVPEPASGLLMLLAGTTLLGIRSRQRK